MQSTSPPEARPPSPVPGGPSGWTLVPVDDAAKRRALRHTPPVLDVELFTDPACPFAFSAEPVRQRLRWHYGDGLSWTVTMIGVTRGPGGAEKVAEGAP